MQSSGTIENVFAKSWDLLTKNWAIVVPGVVVGIVVGIITGLFTISQPAGDEPGVTTTLLTGFAAFAGTVIVAVVAIAGYIVTQCYTAGMAGAAWTRGTATLADGAQALSADAGNVFVAALGLFVLGIVAALLFPFTLGLSIVAFYLFTLWTIPAAVVGNRPGLAALRESFAITRARFGTTLVIAVLLFLLELVGRLIAHLFAFAPLLGPIVAAIIAQIVVAYAMLVIVGEYRILRGAVDPQPPAPGAGTY